MRKKNFEFKTRTWWQEILSSIIAPFLKGLPYFLNRVLDNLQLDSLTVGTHKISAKFGRVSGT
jgi:hypothetical protein